jgi:hypothetical protein
VVGVSADDLDRQIAEAQALATAPLSPALREGMFCATPKEETMQAPATDSLDNSSKEQAGDRDSGTVIDPARLADF